MVKNLGFNPSFTNETGGPCILIYSSTDLHQHNICTDFTARKNYHDPPVLSTIWQRQQKFKA